MSSNKFTNSSNDKMVCFQIKNNLVSFVNFRKIPNSPINWKVNWEYVSHVDFYITPSIQFKFVGFTNEKYPYYGLREVEIHVG